ncbi:MAG: hypothetical protein M3Y33_15450 [Actinomycetota bacterium]|nr:hypothetical protein [Actinomycetota bacterium]
MLLRHYADFSVAEAAMIMDNISPNTVKRYAFDAREKLRKKLNPDAPSGTRKGSS